MNPNYPNAPLLHKFEKPYGSPQCDNALDELQDLQRCLAKLPTKYIITNNRQSEFWQLLHGIIQSATEQLERLGVDLPPQDDTEKENGHSNAFSSYSDDLRWYRPVAGRREAQYAPTMPSSGLQESDVLGNGLSNMLNGIGAWANQTVLQNPTNNYNMVWRRTVGLAQDIADNSVELPPTLRQQLTAQLQQAASLIAPYTNEQGARPPARTSGTRSASVRDLSGLTRMLSDLQALANQAIGNLNPPLVQQFASVLGRCQTLLQQYQQGGASDYPQAAAVGMSSAVPSTAPQQSTGSAATAPSAVVQWAHANGTSPDAFLQRVRGWMSTNGADSSALSTHLQSFGVPGTVIAWTVSQL